MPLTVVTVTIISFSSRANLTFDSREFKKVSGIRIPPLTSSEDAVVGLSTQAERDFVPMLHAARDRE
jgi:hypothetical protein